MKAPQLIRLYHQKCRRYRKVVARLNRGCASAYQKRTFLLELKKLVRKLRELQLQLRIAAATGTVVLMLNAGNSQAQSNPIGPFVLQNRTNNPLRDPIFTSTPIMTVVDFDNDNDDDVVIGEYQYNGAHFRYFENKSSEGNPVYLELTGADNPLESIFAETYQGAPAFADIDQDGDQDLFIGQNGGWVQYSYPYSSNRGIEYYRNDGGEFTKQTGTWDPATKAGNPFDGVKLGYTASPVFIDFDHDGDSDMIAASQMTTGTYPYYTTKYLHYYVNDGNGTFTASATDLTLDTQPSLYGGDTLYPAFADLDGDGDYDLVFGNYYDGYLRYYRQETPGNFIEQTTAWDPVAKTGNPFNSFQLGLDASPVFIDFDNDGLLDLFVGDRRGYYSNKYSDNIINYYHNSGDGVFVEKDEFDNPFDGIFVKQDAAPALVDIDDDGDLDALIGNKYYYSYYDYNKLQYVTVNSYLTHYQNTNGLLKKITGDANPVDTLEVYGNFVPQFADVDGDNDRDLISGDYNGQVTLFRNEDGVYKQDTTSANPFKGLSFPYNGAARLVDIDNDADLDLFISNYGDIHFFVNNGSQQAPAYSELTGGDNPLDTARSWLWGTPYLNFSDLDHDGDPDLLVNGASPYNVEQQTLLFWENTGTAENPKYDTINVAAFQDLDGNAVRLELADYDGDGDLDGFAGLDNGTVRYLENQNEKVITTVTGAVAQYNKGESPVVVEPNLTLTDPDNDFIVQATVSIQNFQAGETLNFTPQPPITGAFDASTGVLTFRGKATLAEYEALLRTVTFEVVDAGGRKGSPKKSIVDKTLAFAVFDADFTNPQVAAKSLQVFINDPPAVGTLTISLTAGGSQTVDLKTIISDPNGAGDLDLTSLKVIQAPASGALTSIDGNGLLTVDYNALAFLGTETMTVEVCDLKGACAQNTLTLVVTNTPPVITAQPVATPAGSSKSINLITITTDVDDNLDVASYTIVQEPSSGAAASIQQVSSTEVNLLLDYRGITFHGNDQLTIGVCDKAGACTESVLVVQVDVDSEVVVYNAVAPNSTGDNRFMRITGLPEKNKVSIFNRWGDRVFDTENYDNNPQGNSFRGLNNNGNALASGTYFYIIEIPGQKDITGYLALKQ